MTGRNVTVEEFLARDERVELIRGNVMEKGSPSGEHSSAQGAVARQVGHRFNRKPGGRWPGGWWCFVELDSVDELLGDDPSDDEA